MIKKKYPLSVLVLLCMVLLISCQDTPGKNDKLGYEAKTIRIHYYSPTVGYSGTIQQLLMLTGKLNEFLPDDVTVEWVDIPSGPDARDALVSGQIDLAVMSETFVIAAIENELPVVLLSGGVFQTAKLYSARPHIKSIADIKNSDKLYTITVGNIFHVSLMLECKDRYNDPQKFNNTLITMGYPELLTELVSPGNIIDCALMSFPNTKKLESMENITPILDLTPTITKYQLTFNTIANVDFFNKNPELIAAVYAAMNETVDFMNTQPEEAAKMLAELYVGIEPADIAAVIRSAPPQLEISESAYNTVAELMHEVGIIPKPPKKFSELPNYDTLPKRP